MRVEMNFDHFTPNAVDRERADRCIEGLGGLVEEWPEASLLVTVRHHARSGDIHVKATLSVSKFRLFTGERHVEFYAALERCVRKLKHKLEHYRAHRRRISERRRAKLERPPVSIDEAALAAAAEARDFPAFRAEFEPAGEEIERDVARAVEKDPSAQAQLGAAFTLGDVVDEVALLAHEGFAERPRGVPLREWLHGLVGPALRALVHRPDEEVENIALAGGR